MSVARRSMALFFAAEPYALGALRESFVLLFVRTTKNGLRRSKTDIKSPATMLRAAAIANGFQSTSFMSIPPLLHKSAQSIRAGTPSSFFIAGIIEQLPHPMQQAYMYRETSSFFYITNETCSYFCPDLTHSTEQWVQSFPIQFITIRMSEYVTKSKILFKRFFQIL